MSRFPRIALVAFLAFLAATGSSQAAGEWKVIKVGQWDYLSVENIAQFYGFAGSIEPIEKTVRLDNGRSQLELTLDSREAIVNGVRNWLCFPVIEKDGKYLVSRIDLAKTIEPQFRPHLINNIRSLKTVVIDAGHGGVEKGAASSYGNEKDFTLDVAQRLKKMLEAKGLRVVMTRQHDDLVPLPQRARIANATKDSIFVSIHFNATDWNSDATGFEIYSLTPRGAPSTQDNSLKARFGNMQAGSPVDAASLILSTSVYHSMLGYMPEFDRGVKRARFAVLRLTQIPAILVEGGFLTERDESRLIAKPAWREQLAQSIAVGIESYRGLVEKKQRPALLADYRRQLDGVLVARDGNAPAAGAASEVIAASNVQARRAAQLTTPEHKEPSPQISIDAASTADSDEDEDEHRTHAGAAEQVAAAESAPAATEPTAEQVAEMASTEMPTPASENADLSSSAAAAPDSSAVDAQTVASVPSVIGPSSPASAPEQIGPPTQPALRRYWVLKFDPPPKFRQ